MSAETPHEREAGGATRDTTGDACGAGRRLVRRASGSGQDHPPAGEWRHPRSRAAQTKEEELGRPAVLAIVDAAPVEIAQREAYTAASFRTPTHEFAETTLTNPARMASLPTLPLVTFLAGGYPILDGEVVVGGIGVSGATPEQDMEIAEAGLAALQA